MAIPDGSPSAQRVKKEDAPASRRLDATTPQQSVKAARKRPAPRGFFARIFGLATRLLTWYSIFVILFRCPANLDACDASSPRICKPYFQAKATVLPRARFYYHTYAGPYVQIVQPYYDTVDRTVLGPSWSYAVKYGAPQVQRARAAGQTQWETTVQPQVVKAQAAAVAQYQQVLAPHVAKVQAAVSPYYDVARTWAVQTYHNVFLKTYELVSPYAIQAGSTAAAFATNKVVPSAVYAWNGVTAFVDGTVLPRLRVVYIDMIEPQLEKLGLKLSQYSGNLQRQQRKTLKYDPSSTISSFTKPAQPSTKAATTTATTSSVSTTSSAAATPQAASKLKRPEPIKQDGAAEDETEERRTARETVAEDLRAWQDKYAKAADEGAAEMESRIEEIARRMIRRNARTTGQGLVDQLQQTITSKLAQLRLDIQAIVASVNEGAVTAEAADAQALAASRAAGREIKERAQAVRTWRKAFTQELQDTVSRAAENHFQILGSIRDLALQKIGMKWAWMDGVTYKDWAKYHQLKGRFDEWESDLEQLIVSHPALKDAEIAGNEVEGAGMELVEAVVAELLRLRQVATWKIAAGDDSDDFDSASTKAAADAKAEADAEAAAAAAAAAEAEASAFSDAAAAEAEGADAEPSVPLEVPEHTEVVDEEITAFTETPAATTETDTVETVALSDDHEPADPITAKATAAAETPADVTSTTETDAEDTTDAGASAATLSPEAVSAVLGEAVDKGEEAEEEETLLTAPAVAAPAAAAMGTTQPEEEEDHEAEQADADADAVHLPVDEVEAADGVPLAVASSVDGAEGEKGEEEPDTITTTRTTRTTRTTTTTAMATEAVAASHEEL